MENQFLTLKNICETRSSCRQFKPNDIPQETIEKIISVATLSPYAGGRKNWNILTVRNKGIKEAISLAIEREVRETTTSLDPENREQFLNYSKNFLFFQNAPVILIPCFRVSPIMKALLKDKVNDNMLQWERDNSVKSISCVAMLMLLTAESLGLGACYMTGPLIAKKRIESILNLPPGREPGAIIPVGYPLE